MASWILTLGAMITIKLISQTKIVYLVAMKTGVPESLVYWLYLGLKKSFIGI